MHAWPEMTKLPEGSTLWTWDDQVDTVLTNTVADASVHAIYVIAGFSNRHLIAFVDGRMSPHPDSTFSTSQPRCSPIIATPSSEPFEDTAKMYEQLIPVFLRLLNNLHICTSWWISSSPPCRPLTTVWRRQSVVLTPFPNASHFRRGHQQLCDFVNGFSFLVYSSVVLLRVLVHLASVKQLIHSSTQIINILCYKSFTAWISPLFKLDDLRTVAIRLKQWIIIWVLI